MSEDFSDYIKFWRHNGFWLFDSPGIMQSLAEEQTISLEGLTLFYYEAHDLEFNRDLYVFFSDDGIFLEFISKLWAY